MCRGLSFLSFSLFTSAPFKTKNSTRPLFPLLIATKKGIKKKHKI